MAPPEFWLFVAFTAGVGAAGLWYGFRWWRWARLIEDTPTSQVRSAAQGLVELVGTARGMPGAPVIAPLSRRQCVWWTYEVERRTQGRKGRSSWERIRFDTSDALFHLQDATGDCIIDPEGAQVLPSQRNTWFGSTAMPEAGPPARRGLHVFGRKYRYRESRLHDGDPLYAIGWFSTERGHTSPDRDAETALLLREWKRDHSSLLKRFDTDGDGTLSLAEWERAREAAHAEVESQRRIASVQPGVHVLRKPDREHPLLLAATQQGKLATRYRIRALVGLAVFVSAAGLLGYVFIGG
ncbi:MAG: GIDE domain-containing protein [Steroidobacteraceae bacterium]